MTSPDKAPPASAASSAPADLDRPLAGVYEALTSERTRQTGMVQCADSGAADTSVKARAKCCSSCWP